MIKRILLQIFVFSICMCTTLMIISLYTNTRDTFPHRQWETSDFIHLRFSNTKSIVTSIEPTKYLWCVNHYGPNNQLRDFIKCCIIALINNYTLIIPPLYPHYGSVKKGIQWLEHFYDLNKLSLILNLITLDQFIPKTKKNSKKLFIDCYLRQIELISGRKWYPQNTLNSIQNYYKINIGFQQYINLSRHFTTQELSMKSKNCSSMFVHIHYTTFAHYFTSQNPYTQKIFESLHRTALIQRMASQLIQILPQLIINKNQTNNTFSNFAVVHMRLGDHIVMSVSMYIKQILFLYNTGVRFTHLHIMCPYLNPNETKQLQDSLPVPFTTTQQLSTQAHLILDNYLFDVLEQEIAYQAPIFLASPWTTYSATVLMQKVYHQKGIVYVFSANSANNPFVVTKKNVKYF